MEELTKILANKGLKAAFGREALLALFTKVWFRKGQLLLVPGQTSETIYFMESGMVRGYQRYEEYEATIWFAHEGLFLLPDGCFSGLPSREYVEFLEDSTAYALSIKQADALIADIPQLSAVFIKLLEEKVVVGKLREEMLRRPSAADRYRFLQESYPYVVRHASQEMLASYLNLSPKHLSRVRKQEAKGKNHKK